MFLGKKPNSPNMKKILTQYLILLSRPRPSDLLPFQWQEETSTATKFQIRSLQFRTTSLVSLPTFSRNSIPLAAISSAMHRTSSVRYHCHCRSQHHSFSHHPLVLYSPLLPRTGRCGGNRRLTSRWERITFPRRWWELRSTLSPI